MKSEALQKFSNELKQKRESYDITLQQIFNKTRIDIKYLEAIENADFDIMPDVYMRAFIKEYARAIDLDPETTLKQFENAKAGIIEREPEKAPEEEPAPSEEEVKEEQEPETTPEEKEEEPVDEPEPAPKVIKEAPAAVPPPNKEYDATKETVTIEGSKGGNTNMYVWGGVAVIILLVIAYFVFFYDSAGEIVTQNESTNQPAVQEPRFEVSGEEETSEAPVPKDSLALTVTASDTAWIRVEIDDTKQDEFILYPNGSKDLKGLTKFNLIIGNSGGVDLYLDGSKLNFKGTAGKVRNVEVTSQGLQDVQTNPVRRNE